MSSTQLTMPHGRRHSVGVTSAATKLERALEPILFIVIVATPHAILSVLVPFLAYVSPGMDEKTLGLVTEVLHWPLSWIQAPLIENFEFLGLLLNSICFATCVAAVCMTIRRARRSKTHAITSSATDYVK